nr:immunoglobulin light chain junction region [Macaca mulatta]MPN96900.1 immunoglobulin light chain junction region [Macaca mulatta]MPN97722.1 immunoglobulin light chain junction region [Macaca mulatta]MPN99195.1 immunoglobulin light chain junction region [Macaca mulatta]MPO02711.1 immunoglobulin light chain junction region [Macaca mulatta]
CQHGYGIPFTC